MPQYTSAYIKKKSFLLFISIFSISILSKYNICMKRRAPSPHSITGKNSIYSTIFSLLYKRLILCILSSLLSERLLWRQLMAFEFFFLLQLRCPRGLRSSLRCSIPPFQSAVGGVVCQFCDEVFAFYILHILRDSRGISIADLQPGSCQTSKVMGKSLFCIQLFIMQVSILSNKSWKREYHSSTLVRPHSLR